jgi:ribosomal protein S18 acetylase RimI-like enzyme
MPGGTPRTETEDSLVRSYSGVDRSDVLALWLRVFDDDPQHNDGVAMLERKQQVQPELFLVAERAGRVVGSVMAGYDGVRGWVHRLAVEPGSRRRGIGALLMQEAERRLAAVGCPKLNLQIRGGNAAVEAFYQRLGYHVEDRIDMGKRLE